MDEYEGLKGNSTPNYEVAQCPQLGRYLVATRNIKRGEVILTDLPVVTGPQKGSPLLCPGCYEPPTTTCTNCNWPVCSSACIGAKNHEPECKLLQLRQNGSCDKQAMNHYWSQMMDSLMIVRCMLLKVNDHRKWKRLSEMETNWDQWSRSPLYKSAQDIHMMLRNDFGMSLDEFPSSEIMRIQAILDINAYEVRMLDTNVQAAYTLANLVEHNCTPNAHKTICSDSLELTFRAATDIPQGAHISTSYCDILWPTWHRQKYLQWSKFFICTCARCQSTTELETHLASLLCMDCYKTSQEPVPAAATPVLNENENWKTLVKDYQCSTCNVVLPALECQLVFKKASKEMSDLDKDASFETIYAFEHWLNKWTLMERIVSCETCEGKDDDRDEINKTEHSEIPKRQKAKCYPSILLHPQHSLVLDVCHTLFLLYPKEDCTLNQLKRKECFGTHLLNTTKPLFTGLNKFRGTIIYELAMTRAAILVHQLEQSGMTANLQHLAEEVLQLLSESQELLKFEPLEQPEGQLALSAASQLEQLTLFFSELFPQISTLK